MYLEQWNRYYAPVPKYATRPDESKFFFIKKFKALFKKYYKKNEE